MPVLGDGVACGLRDSPAFTIFLIVWQRRHVISPADITFVVGSPADRLQTLQYALPNLSEMTVAMIGFLSGAVGIALLPLAVAALR